MDSARAVPCLGWGCCPAWASTPRPVRPPRPSAARAARRAAAATPAKAARQAKEAAAAKQAKIEAGQSAAPAAGSSFGLGGGQADASGYGIMPQAQQSKQPSGDDVADAMGALPEDLRRHLGL